MPKTHFYTNPENWTHRRRDPHYQVMFGCPCWNISGRATTHGVGDGGGIHLKNINFQWFAASANSSRFGIANGSLIFFAILTVKQTGLLCASASHRVSWRHDPDFLWSWPAIWLKGHEYYTPEGYTYIIWIILYILRKKLFNQGPRKQTLPRHSHTWIVDTSLIYHPGCQWQRVYTVGIRY